MGISLKKQMVTVITRKVLVEALKKLSHVIDAKSKIPVYQMVKFDVTDNDIKITATSDDVTAVTTLQHNYPYEKSSFVISYQYLSDFLKKSKADLIEFDTTLISKVSIKASFINFETISYDSSEFPLLPDVNFDFLDMDVNDFKTAMKNTIFACATSESRPVLTGVNINFDTHKHLRFVATDSHRLASYTFHTFKNTSGEQLFYNVTVPNSTLSKILKLIGKNTKTVTIGFNEYQTFIKFDDVEFWVKNLQGNYPDIERLIPDNYKTKINLYSNELQEASSALSMLAKHDRNNVIRLEHSDKQTTLNSNSPELGSMTADLLVSHFTGEDIRVSFSAKYFIDALNALNCETVFMNFNGALSPFTIINPLDEKALHLILPVRTY